MFVEEQGFPLEQESDEHDRTDPTAVHALARRDGGAALGTGRFCMVEPGVGRIGRMAVLPEARGRGAGASLLAALLGEAGRRGYGRIVLLAQPQARAFYARAGFREDGSPLWAEGLLHQPMAKTVQSDERG